MTNQETFDIVYRHLMTQMEKSGGENECFYRGVGGLKCAIGVLIPDEKYREDLEGLGASVVLAELEIPHDNVLCYRLQEVHDYSEAKDWDTQLRNIADEFGLTVPSMEAVHPEPVHAGAEPARDIDFCTTC